MNAQDLIAMDMSPAGLGELRILRCVPDPGMRIQDDHEALSHLSSSGEIKSSWNTMLPFNGFTRPVSLGT
jgi:hypothetical protein